jgi:hypothetical protein
MAKDIEPKLKLIKGYLTLEEGQKFQIPEYQRGYSWRIEHCDKLWQDIEQFIESETDDPYFFGTVILDCSSDNAVKNDRVLKLIDGQQRTTTFLLLLKALYLRLQNALENFGGYDEATEPLRRGMQKSQDEILDILYNTHNDEEKQFAIKKNPELCKGVVVLENCSINECYKTELQTILEARDFDEIERSVVRFPRKKNDNKYTNFFRNFKFFYEKLNCDSTKVNKFAKVFLSKCQVIEIRSWQIEQAIAMFNSLNSTGMPLSDADIISAQLYSNSDNKDDFTGQWKRIIGLASDLNAAKIVSIDSVLQQFMYINRALADEYKDGEVTVPGVRAYYLRDHSDLLKKPKDLCDSFEKILQVWKVIKDFPTVKLLLKFNENSKLFLISYLSRFDVEELTQDKVRPMVECLLRLFTILELVDAGYSSANFKTFLFNINKLLVNKDCPIERIETCFNEHIQEKWHPEELKARIKEYSKNILVFLNEYLYAKKECVSFNFADNVNVEHIMPSSGHDLEAIRKDAGVETREEFDELVNQLGNKILLEEDVNKSIGKSWFQTKKGSRVTDKKGYLNSSYGLATALSVYPMDIWGKTDIELATAKAAQRIVKFVFGN